MLVINGLYDQTVLPEWVTKAVARSCSLRGTIKHSEIPDARHCDLRASANHTGVEVDPAPIRWYRAPTSNCQVRR
jgi:hypothetical protein